VAAVASDFCFAGACFFAELAAILFSGWSDAGAGDVSTFRFLIGCHEFPFEFEVAIWMRNGVGRWSRCQAAFSF